MEPILVEDYKISEESQSIKNILNYLKGIDPNSSRNEILMGLIYILCLETGFVPKEEYDENTMLSHNFNYQNIKTFSLKLPLGWKINNVYNFSFILPPFTQHEMQITAVFISADIVINCVVNEIEEAQFTICLDPLLYFSSSCCDINSYHLQNIKHLSKNIKDSLSYSAKQAILHQNGIISECFEQLPPEIVLEIMKLLDVKSLISLSQVNSMCHRIMKSPILWLRLLYKDYNMLFRKEKAGSELKPVVYEHVRNAYKKQYLTNKKPMRTTWHSSYIFNFGSINF